MNKCEYSKKNYIVPATNNIHEKNNTEISNDLDGTINVLNSNLIYFSECKLYNSISNFQGNTININMSNAIDGTIRHFIFDNCPNLTLFFNLTSVIVTSSLSFPVIIRICYLNGRIVNL